MDKLSDFQQIIKSEKDRIVKSSSFSDKLKQDEAKFDNKSFKRIEIEEKLREFKRIKKSHKYDIKSRKGEIKLQKQYREMRKDYADICVRLVIWSLLIVVIIIFFKGYGVIKLSDKIVLALISGLFVETIACFYLIIKSLFPNEDMKYKCANFKSK